MDPKFQTSFIPKKPVLEGRPRASGGLFYTISTIIFAFAVIVSLAVFGYQQFLKTDIKQMESELTAARDALQPDLISELSRVNAGFESARELIDSHRILSPFFNLLESLTLQAVRFNQFTYMVEDRGKISIAMNGEARSYATVALQSKIFSEDPNFRNPQFSNLDINTSGNVTFSFKTEIDPKLISYTGTLESFINPELTPPVSSGTASSTPAASTTAQSSTQTP